MTNSERLFLIKAAGANPQLQPMYDPNDQASMLEAYKNRGQPNMSFTPDASTLPGNFGFSNQQDFNRAKGLIGKFRSNSSAGLYGRASDSWQGVSPQMTQGVMDMRRSIGGTTQAIDLDKKDENNLKFTAPETQTGYDTKQPGGSNYYHGLHHLGTDEYGDHTFSSKPKLGDVQFMNQSGTGYNHEAFDKAMKEYEDGVANYEQYGTFNPTEQQTGGGGDLLSRRLAERGNRELFQGASSGPRDLFQSASSGAGDLLSRRLAERGMGPGMNVGGQIGSDFSGSAMPATGTAATLPQPNSGVLPGKPIPVR